MTLANVLVNTFSVAGGLSFAREARAVVVTLLISLQAGAVFEGFVVGPVVRCSRRPGRNHVGMPY